MENQQSKPIGVFILDDTQYLRFRIKHVIRKLQEKKKKLRDPTKKNPLSDKILFYQGILDKIEESTGDIEYSIFTDEEVFYITILLKIRGVYSEMKELSERHFDVEDKLQGELNVLLKRVLELDPTLYSYFLKIHHSSRPISPILGTVKSQLNLDGIVDENSVSENSVSENIYSIWISNIFTSFRLLEDHWRWRPANFNNDKWMGCCKAPCNCYINEVEERVYKDICRNIFFNPHRFHPPPMKFWGFCAQ
jgi:hypothetical protein